MSTGYYFKKNIFEPVGPVELDVNILQGDARCQIVTVDLGSVCKTQEGDPVYWLEKADILQRNKWELIIAMEFSSGLKGTVKSRPFQVTTKVSSKMKRDGGGKLLYNLDSSYGGNKAAQ